MDVNIFAKRLTDLLEERNVTPQELAEALGINKATIYRYKAAEINKIKMVTIKAIAEYLNVNPDYLIGVSDSKHTAQEAEALMADITDAEKMLLELFRQVPTDDQPMALDVLRAVLKRGQ